jgi:hypothetical protein
LPEIFSVENPPAVNPVKTPPGRRWPEAAMPTVARSSGDVSKKDSGTAYDA